MSTTRTRRARGTASSLLSVMAASLLAGGLLMVGAPPAAAHDNLISSTPEAGSTVKVSPEEISITFSGELLTAASSVVIEVTSPDGQNVTDGEPVVDGTTVTQMLTAGPSTGVFTVLWRVVSSDGHPISDQYTYTVQAATGPTGTAAPDGMPTQTAEPTATARVDVHSGPSRGGAFLPLMAVVGGAIIIGGARLVVLLGARKRRRRDRPAAAVAAGREAAAETRQMREHPTDT